MTLSPSDVSTFQQDAPELNSQGGCLASVSASAWTLLATAAENLVSSSNAAKTA